MCADNFNNRKMFERRNVGHDNKYQGAPTKCRVSRIRNIKFTQPSSLLLVWTENCEMYFLSKCSFCSWARHWLSALCIVSSPWSILVINAVWCYPHIIADKSHLTSQFRGKTKPKIDNRSLKNCQANTVIIDSFANIVASNTPSNWPLRICFW